MTQHQWGPSRVGHGEVQCIWCGCTNREALFALGMKCDRAPVEEMHGSVIKFDGLYIYQSPDGKLRLVEKEEATIFDEGAALRIYLPLSREDGHTVEMIDV